MTRKLLPLAFVLALAAACAEPPDPEVRFGSGERFVPFVADSLNDAGVRPSVVVAQEGLPVVTYFAFEERAEEGELPQARPVGAPTLPGVLMATVSQEGIWTRGAMALADQIPNITVPFNPGTDESIANLEAGNVTGLQAVADGETVHATWGSADGLWYATGPIEPNATESFQIQQVSSTPPFGPSIAVDGNGTPWIAFLTSTSASATVELATPEGDGWQIETVSTAASCEACRTAVVATPDGPAVAFAAGEAVWVAVNEGESGWASFDVESGGQGLSGVGSEQGVTLSYYSGDEVHVATIPAPGQSEISTITSVTAGSAEADGAGTSVAVDDTGALWIGWFDAADGVGFATSDGVIETGVDTASGAMPSVAVAADGSTAYLAWYDTVNQDLLVGAYGDLQDLAIAAPSPEPTGGGATSAPPGECLTALDGVVTMVARGIAFVDAPCVSTPADEPITLEFDNQDDGIPHNVAIYPSADEVSADAAIIQPDPFNGIDQQTYDVPALDAGEYYFQCDVHPTMSGAWNAGDTGDGGTGATGATGVTGATGETGGGDGGGDALTVTAQNIQFDTDTIDLPADAASTISFDNQDAGTQHNISIYADDSASESLFAGELITGPDTIDYAIDPIVAGEYYFQCDVHPTMNGSVVVG